MTNYIDAEKLKAEIERRMDKHWEGLPDADSPEDDWTHNELCELGAYKELEHIEDFLNSLQQEQTEVDLEKEVENFCLEYDSRKEVWFDMTPRDKKMLSVPTWSNFAANIARHFYELGKKGNKELNKKPKNSNDSDMGSPWRNHIIEDINN